MKSTSTAGKKHAILYTRVSTDEQAENYSLGLQEERLRQYCQINHIAVIEHFQDDASAKSFDRPAFNDLLAFLKKHRREVDVVLFTRWDRFSRNAEAAYRMIRQLRDQGVSVQAIEQPIDLSIPENKLMLAFYLAAPEVENDRRSKNTKEGMRKAKLEGRWVGYAPKGYSYQRLRGESKSVLVPNETAKLVLQAFERYAKGVYTQEEVRLYMRKKGMRISNTAFGKMLRNPVYKGQVVVEAWKDYEEQVVEGVHKPIVSSELFQKVQKTLAGGDRRRKDKPSTRHDELPLRGYLTCRKCSGNLTGSRSKSRSGTYYWYYHCQNGCDERFSAPTANDDFIALLREVNVPKEVAELYLAVVQDIFAEHGEDREAQIANVDANLLKIEKNLADLDERYFRGEFEKDSFLRLKKRFTERQREFEKRRRELERLDTDFDRYLRYGLSLLTTLPRSYAEAPLEVKQKLIGLIFPEKLVYDEGKYRTAGMNEVLLTLIEKKQQLKDNRKGIDRLATTDQSRKVGPAGFEPATSRV